MKTAFFISLIAALVVSHKLSYQMGRAEGIRECTVIVKKFVDEQLAKLHKP